METYPDGAWCREESVSPRLIAEQPKDVRGVAYLRKRVQAESIVTLGQIGYEVVAFDADGDIGIYAGDQNSAIP